VEYLDKLSTDTAGDVDLQRELAWGYQRLSAVQGDTSQSNLGQISAAEVSIRKSIALFEAVAKANPKNVTDQLNLAMAYRRRAFTDIYERNGRQEIDQALAISAPLMQTDGARPEVRSERSLELQILASVEDATGERLKAIDTFRQYLDLRRGISRSNPETKGIHRSVAHATIELAYQLGRFGNRDEAMQLFDQGIAQYEALVKEGANPDTIRDLAASELRRGQVNLMRADPAAAIVDFHHARDSTARLLKLDPKNEMLQSDVCGFDHDEGRALVVSGMVSQGLVLLQRSLQCFHGLHLEADTGPGTGAMEAWIAEAQARSHNLPEALKHYQTAAAALAADIDKYDDARCDLAMVETKIANTLLHMGKLSEASEHYAKAVDLAGLPLSLEHMDIPALYAAADAHSGLGNLAAAKAQKTQGPAARSALENIARRAYADSLNVWKQIPSPSPITPNGYLVGEPLQLLLAAAARLGVQATPK
jgi:tetratricopeptide (TPR) repeat protein